MSYFEYECPHCDSEMHGDFGEDVECEKCQLTFETEFDYFGEDYNLSSWVVGEGKSIKPQELKKQ